MIANSGHPDALKLIRQILLASASVPGGFPPVLIEVQAGNKKYGELHVDGGATSQVFLYPVGIDYYEVVDKLAVPGRPEVYIIRDSHLDPTCGAVKSRFLPILGRSIESIVQTQGIGDLYRNYLQTCRDGLDFNLAYIPSNSTAESEGSVDTEYMEKLFAWPSTSPMRATLGRRRRPSSTPRRSAATEFKCNDGRAENR